LRKLGKYMERKVRKTEKISSILTINIKIELIFFLRKNYCPTLYPAYFLELDTSDTPSFSSKFFYFIIGKNFRTVVFGL
ncbi:IS5/IS1182 family transposase, partial [Enterococcus hirae]|nr:IS5/IS1182 family transposase [Enterococcus hirae]